MGFPFLRGLCCIYDDLRYFDPSLYIQCDGNVQVRWILVLSTLEEMPGLLRKVQTPQFALLIPFLRAPLGIFARLLYIFWFQLMGLSPYLGASRRLVPRAIFAERPCTLRGIFRISTRNLSCQGNWLTLSLLDLSV